MFSTPPVCNRAVSVVLWGTSRNRVPLAPAVAAKLAPVPRPVRSGVQTGIVVAHSSRFVVRRLRFGVVGDDSDLLMPQGVSSQVRMSPCFSWQPFLTRKKNKKISSSQKMKSIFVEYGLQTPVFKLLICVKSLLTSRTTTCNSIHRQT